MVVDNLPHATFKVKDAQLEAAVAYLQKRIREQPVPLIRAPKFPQKTVRPGKE
jgi:tricorn protease